MTKPNRWGLVAPKPAKKKNDAEKRFRRKVERAANRWIGGCKVKA